MELEKVARKLFEFLDQQNRKILSGKKIFPLFSSSGLPTKTLARVWEISAQGKKGIDVTQFELALRIISLAQTGIPLNKMKEKITDPNISVPQLKYPVKFRIKLQKAVSSPPKNQVVTKKRKSPKKKAALKVATSPITKKPRVHSNNVVAKDVAKSAMPIVPRKPKVTAAPPKNTSLSAEKIETKPNTAVKLKETATEVGSKPALSIEPPQSGERVPPLNQVKLEEKSRDHEPMIPQKATTDPHLSPFPKKSQRSSSAEEIASQSKPDYRRSRKNAEADLIIQEAIALQKQSVDLRKRNVLLESEISRLKTSSSENLINVDSLTRENQKLKKRFGNSAKLVKQLTQQNKQFSQKNSELKQRLMDVIKTNEMLEKDLQDNESQSGGLKKRLEDNVKLIIELTQQGLDYAKENRTLQYRVNEATRKEPSISRSTETFEFAKRDIEYSKREFEFGRRDLISRCVVLDPHEDYHQISINALASLSDFDMTFDKEGLEKNDQKRTIETESGDMTPSSIMQAKPPKKSYSSFTSKKPDDIFRKAKISSSLLMTPGHDSQFAAILSATLTDGKDSFRDFESGPATPDSKSYKIRTSKVSPSDDFHDFDFCAGSSAASYL